MKLVALFKRACFSLSGHIALFQVCWGIPMALLFIGLNYHQGTLTPSWALWCVVVSSVGATILAILIWYTVSKSLIRRNRRLVGRREKSDGYGA